MLSNCTDMISVIIPAYNIEKYLPRCLDSILNQTYKNLEIIVVDDGSVDGTAKVMSEYAQKDSRIVAVYVDNAGVTKTRLTGVENATGDWVGFVDGDDIIDPDMYEVLLSNAQKYNADISHCGYKMVFPSRTDYYYNTGKFLEQENISGVRDLLQGSFIEPCMCNKLYRKKLIDKVLATEKIDLSIRNTEDLLINYYIFKHAHKSVYLDKCFYHYILRKGSAATSKVNEHKLKDPLKVLKIIKKDCEDNIELQNILNARISANLISVSTMSTKKNPQLIKPYRKQVRKELRSLLSVIIKGNFSIKRKIVTLWVAMWPWSYGAVHSFYGKISGIDKKYEVK